MNDLLIKGRYGIKNIDKALIGSGGFGSVFAGIDEQTKKKVAIKMMLLDNEDPSTRKKSETDSRSSYYDAALLDEIDAFKGIGCHPNVVCVIDSLKRDKVGFIIMEYIKGSEFKIDIDWDPVTRRDYLFNVFTQLIHGLNFIHSKGYLHMDLKTNNILVEKEKLTKNPTGKVKIVDLGIACKRNSCRIRGTNLFMDPFMIKNRKADYYELDIYSLGITLFLALGGKKYFPMDFDFQRNEFITTILMEWADHPSNQIYFPINKWILQMCSEDPNFRPTTDDIMNSIKQGYPERIAVGAKVDPIKGREYERSNFGIPFRIVARDPNFQDQEEEEKEKEPIQPTPTTTTTSSSEPPSQPPPLVESSDTDRTTLDTPISFNQQPQDIAMTADKLKQQLKERMAASQKLSLSERLQKERRANNIPTTTTTTNTAASSQPLPNLVSNSSTSSEETLDLKTPEMEPQPQPQAPPPKKQEENESWWMKLLF